jgi:hypothetical protein
MEPQPQELKELPIEIRVRLDDKTLDVNERLALARSLISQYGELDILLAQSGVADGLGYEDGSVSQEQLILITNELGFVPSEFETVAKYEWRTTSRRHPDLILQVKTGPINMGGPSELFPNWQAWSEYDHVNSFRIIVLPPTIKHVPSAL